MAGELALLERRAPVVDDERRRSEALVAFARVLAGARERSDALSECCSVLARARAYALVWVGRGEPDGSVSTLGCAGDATEFLRDIEFRWDDRREGAGPIGLALRRRETAIVKVNEPSFAPWRDRARSFGIRCVVALPIAGDSEVRHALAACSTDARQVWGQDLQLLTRLAIDVAAAL